MRLGMVIAASAALALTIGSAAAELRLVVSDTPDHRIVLENRPSEVQAEVVALVGEADAPMLDVIDCASLDDRLGPIARSEDLSLDVLLARYNLAGQWLGDLCPGVASAMSPEEGRAWLTELAGLRRASDGAPFLRARDMLLQLHLFGAPGVAPDYAAAQAQLATEAPQYPELYLALMTERGLGQAPDQAEAARRLRLAADAGSTDARALLAQAMELGLGVPQDDAGARALYEELATRISTPVWYRLGRMYFEGRGGPADRCLARNWLNLAATHAWSPVSPARDYLAAHDDMRLCAD